MPREDPAQPLLQGLALQQFHDEKRAAVAGFADVVNRADVGVGQRRDRPCLSLETFPGDGSVREVRRQHFQRDVPPEAGVARLVDLAHAASPDGGEDLIRSETGTRGRGYWWRQNGCADCTRI